MKKTTWQTRKKNKKIEEIEELGALFQKNKSSFYFIKKKFEIFFPQSFLFCLYTLILSIRMIDLNTFNMANNNSINNIQFIYVWKWIGQNFKLNQKKTVHTLLRLKTRWNDPIFDGFFLLFWCSTNGYHPQWEESHHKLSHL